MGKGLADQSVQVVDFLFAHLAQLFYRFLVFDFIARGVGGFISQGGRDEDQGKQKKHQE